MCFAILKTTSLKNARTLIFTWTIQYFYLLFLTFSFKDIETKIQPYVANIIMAGSLITSILPAILSLLLGPWSDKFGRRPVLIATFAGR